MENKKVVNKFKAQNDDLALLIKESFPARPYPDTLPIGIIHCRSEYVDHPFYSNADAQENEVIFRGGTEEKYYEMTSDPDDSDFNEFVRCNRPLLWTDMAGSRLSNWAGGWELAVLMPEARAYYLPAFMITYAPAFYLKEDEFEGLPCYLDAAWDVFNSLLPPYNAGFQDTEVWLRAEEITASKNEKYRYCLPSHMNLDLDYLLFVSCFNKDQQSAIWAFIRFVYATEKEQRKLVRYEEKEYERLRTIWF